MDAVTGVEEFKDDRSAFDSGIDLFFGSSGNRVGGFEGS
jgi:hypothetical protein